jgi:hypothetical protein
MTTGTFCKVARHVLGSLPWKERVLEGLRGRGARE